MCSLSKRNGVIGADREVQLSCYLLQLLEEFDRDTDAMLALEVSF